MYDFLRNARIGAQRKRVRRLKLLRENACIEAVGQQEQQATNVDPNAEQFGERSRGQEGQHSERVDEEQHVQPPAQANSNNDVAPRQSAKKPPAPALQLIDTFVSRRLPPS